MSAKVQVQKKVTKSDLWKSFLIWTSFAHACYNWERLQGVGFCHTMIPIIRRLYDTKEEISAALKRHLVFFNTQPAIGGLIHGMTIALEEKRANGAKEITDETINGLKTALMGPLAGLGDTLVQATVRPLLLAIGIGWAVDGNILGPLFFFVTFTAFLWGAHYLCFMYGYKWGQTAAVRLLEGGLMRKLTIGASIVGLTVAGVMVTRFVSVTIPLTITAGNATVNLGKDFLDALIPGILPLITSLVCWRLMVKKVPTIRILAGIFVVGFIGGALGLLGK